MLVLCRVPLEATYLIFLINTIVPILQMMNLTQFLLLYSHSVFHIELNCAPSSCFICLFPVRDSF